MGARARARSAGASRRRRAGAGLRRAGGDRLCAGVRHPLRARHHPQPLCRPHLHPADAVDPRARRAAEAHRQPRGGRRASASCWSTIRSCAAPPRRKIVQMMRDAGAKEVHFRIASPPITHPGLLRHRHARARQAARRHARSRRHAQVHRRRFARLPVGRRHLPRDGLRGARSRCARSSPTTASPATIRPRSPTSAPAKPARGSCRCSPKRFRCAFPLASRVMSKPLAGRIALVTGASRGIGARGGARAGRKPARMWWRSRARSAGWKSSTTRSRPPAARPRWCRST